MDGKGSEGIVFSTRPRGVFGNGQAGAKSLGGGGRGADVGVRAGGVEAGHNGEVERRAVVKH